MFSTLDLAFIGALLLSPSAATPISHRSISGGLRVSRSTAKAFAPAAPIARTDNYVALKRSKGTPRSAAYLHALRHAQNGGGSSPLIPEGGGVEYIMDIQFNSVDVKVIVDTGSSDTWLAESGFRCVDASGTAQNASACGFGATYPSSFGANQIKNTNFNISYGDGEFVTGDFGTADITIAGITVPQQTAALGTYAYWNGDGVSAGLLGLAYDALTSQYSGTDPTKDSNANRILYNPIFTTMYKTGLSSAMFSMAIERGVGGFLAFGGLPPVNPTGGWANTTIQKMKLSSGSQDYAFYTMTPDGFSINGNSTKTTDQYIVDSGTTLVYAASSVAQAINNAFSPPAVLDSGYYNVNCNATAPQTGVTIGGTTFFINATDLILPNSDGTCTSGIQDGGSGPYILGDVFMTNAVVIFDVGAAQLRFAAHESY